MPMLDAFNTDAFGLVSLTKAIQKAPFKPARIGEMGLFTPQGVSTTTCVFEEDNGKLALLPTKRRGEPRTPNKGSKRTVRTLPTLHIPLQDTIMAEDVQNVRKFGSENQLEGVADVVNRRMVSMRQHHEVTLEYHRIGAIHGKVLDSDGSTELYDLFTTFGVSETEVDFLLSTSTTDVRNKCVAVARAIEDALGAALYTGIHCLCGEDFFDALISHEDTKAAYERWRDGEILRQDVRRGFSFAGITFEEYRGTVSGVTFLAASVARFFPVGVPDLFTTYFAPADYMETVNTIGQNLYAKQERMPLDVGIMLDTQQNPLCVCHRPGVLIKGNQTT